MRQSNILHIYSNKSVKVHSQLIQTVKSALQMISVLKLKRFKNMVSKIYPGIAENYKNRDWLCETAILAAKNDAVHELNSRIQEMIPGPVTEYRSIDTVVDNDDAVNFFIEFLNSVDLPGMPPHRLHL
ncbi:hypothetical protein AVEN_253635-1 [Araneus ventricosus]|uniref:Uncharacterized protein n=1 Tax=Araneus ventricosus TaxID=182803 RepID=A0A4Y2LU85_ARAVE|nr:hypothetical protein AVEN_253635-1 [Araneus ventricosus]